MASTPAQAQEVKHEALLRPAFNSQAFRVNRSLPITFVCGGTDPITAYRHQFLEKIQKGPKRIISILAERAFPHQLIVRNLLEFEKFLGGAADCVLIFVESVGSYAETGMFAALEKVAEKTLVINDRSYSEAPSFLNRGAIGLIRKRSVFDAVLDVGAGGVTDSDAAAIVNRITETLPKYKNALVFQPTAKFADLSVRLQLASVQVAVTLLRAASADIVTNVLRQHFGAVEHENVECSLSVLTGIELLEREDEIYFVRDPLFFTNPLLVTSVDFPAATVRARAMEWHQQNNAQIAVFLREKLGVDI
jgi:hypothetical protein